MKTVDPLQEASVSLPEPNIWKETYHRSSILCRRRPAGMRKHWVCRSSSCFPKIIPGCFPALKLKLNPSPTGKIKYGSAHGRRERNGYLPCEILNYRIRIIRPLPRPCLPGWSWMFKNGSKTTPGPNRAIC